MKNIVISEFMNAEPVERLKAKYNVHWDDTLVEKRADLLQAVGEASAIIVRNKTQVDRELLESAPNLVVVGRLGVGLDNIDMDACAERGVTVCPATGANAPSVTEYVIGSAFALVRKSFFSTNRIVAGEWPRSELSVGGELGGRVMGLIGFGGIGQQVAVNALGLGMQTIAYDPMLPDDASAWDKTKRATLDDVISTADIISLHVPLNSETHGMINSAVLNSMKPGAILINTARGGIIDEHALADALRSGHLGGAAIDVFDDEPASIENMKPFVGLDNVILTPHIAGLTTEANVRVSELTVTNVLKVLEAQS